MWIAIEYISCAKKMKFLCELGWFLQRQSHISYGQRLDYLPFHDALCTPSYIDTGMKIIVGHCPLSCLVLYRTVAAHFLVCQPMLL